MRDLHCGDRHKGLWHTHLRGPRRAGGVIAERLHGSSLLRDGPCSPPYHVVSFSGDGKPRGLAGLLVLRWAVR
jgi:hypothetical protein